MNSGHRVLLSLGSNQGGRRQNLLLGINALIEAGFSIDQVSPVVESAAVLPRGVPSKWNRPFLNVNVFGAYAGDLESFYSASKLIQNRTARDADSAYAPRELDIDIVSWGDQMVSLNGRQIPDSRDFARSFVVSPLVHVAPGFRFPGSGETALEMSRSISHHIPLWMGIINVTPDSFSDGGAYQSVEDVESAVIRMIQNGANIIDIGAESTRPNAVPLCAFEEWARLSEVLEGIKRLIGTSPLRPRLSLDTYRPETAEKALKIGVDMINDVTGLADERMMSLARDSGCEFVAMHSIAVPVDVNRSLGVSDDAVAVFEDWLKERKRQWSDFGLDLDRIIIDPGIGFGKSRLQSLDLMRSIAKLRSFGHRVLIGHSRKRHMQSFSSNEFSDLDPETIGVSLQLCAQNVDILRVHNVESHTRAYLSWAHLQANTVDPASGR